MKHLLTIPALLLMLAENARAGENFSLPSSLLQVTWALLIVLGLIFLLHGLIMRHLRIRGKTDGSIIIIETKHVMPKQALLLVRVENRKLLLALGQNGINLLADLGTETLESQNETEKTT